MQKAEYKLRGGRTLVVEYDPQAPCRLCGEPVVEASVGGTDVCPWCDMGKYRDGHERVRWPDARPAPTKTLDLDDLPSHITIEDTEA